MTEKGDDKTVRYATICCARGGKACNRKLNVTRPCPTGKTECKVKINVLKVDEKFKLTTIHNIYNHDLSPKKSRFFRYNRQMSDSIKRVIDINDLAGIRMKKSFGSLVVGAGSFENLSFLEKDCHNYIDKARHLRLGAGDAGMIREYFLRMQYKNPKFFALMDLDDDGRSPIENRFQELYTNAKFREVHKQLTCPIDLDSELIKRDGAVKTYLVEDEDRVEDFTKLVTCSMDFSKDDVDTKCSCGLFQIRAGSKKHTEDATYKLYAMIDLYRKNKEPPSMTLDDSNVVTCTTQETVIGGSSHKIDGGDTQLPNTSRNLFGPSEIDMSNVGHVQEPVEDSLVVDII
ncbi:uncharacterized protein LOC122299591 [Carya illinoinensis]|uniref:uncharacterized protein LOC122299591 n=1 Tax=Carya illinoinensis TaxID=32201 RepID=UPI001C7238F3|nr:uncharacterized protein LOC122299591 [Carya illinoinensis]